ncbi:MAG: NAD(P)H-dependent oxidoreductase [Planctomycetes bacterium]|nr:NAD(P)H-dependent oxidoreductase [Planctomycetota bacterium]
MPTLSPADLTARLEWRYACKKFDPARKIDPAVWAALERSLVLAPSSFGLQPWRFLVVEEAGLRQRLRAASWNQPQVTEASHVVVFARRTEMKRADVDRLIQRIVDVRKTPATALDSYRGMMLGFVEQPAPGFDASAWTARQTYIALGFFLAGAAVLGVDACPMEGIDPAQYDALLDLKGTGYTTTVVATAGYRAADDRHATEAKVRYAEPELLIRR